MTGARTEFVTGLYALSARETRERLAAAIAAAKSLQATEGPRGRVLQDALGDVEASLLAAARAAVVRLDAALREATRPVELADHHDAEVAKLDEGRPPPPVRPIVRPRPPFPQRKLQ